MQQGRWERQRRRPGEAGESERHSTQQHTYRRHDVEGVGLVAHRHQGPHGAGARGAQPHRGRGAGRRGGPQRGGALSRAGPVHGRLHLHQVMALGGGVHHPERPAKPPGGGGEPAQGGAGAHAAGGAAAGAVVKGQEQGAGCREGGQSEGGAKGAGCGWMCACRSPFKENTQAACSPVVVVQFVDPSPPLSRRRP